MFRNDHQRAKVTMAIVGPYQAIAPLWTTDGPTECCIDLFEHPDKRVFSSGEGVLFKLAWDVWNGMGGAGFSDLLDRLDYASTRRIGALLVAMADGSSTAIDAWLQKYGPHAS